MGGGGRAGGLFYHCQKIKKKNSPLESIKSRDFAFPTAKMCFVERQDGGDWENL